MRGVTFKGNREAEIQEFPDPHAGPGQAVLRIMASGLCGTDLHRYRDAGPTEMITGHEPCGVIEELGPGAPPGLGPDGAPGLGPVDGGLLVCVVMFTHLVSTSF